MDKPRVIIFVEGGVVQSVRSSIPIQVDVLDYDDMDDVQESVRNQNIPDDAVALLKMSALEVEYNNLPNVCY